MNAGARPLGEGARGQPRTTYVAPKPASRRIGLGANNHGVRHRGPEERAVSGRPVPPTDLQARWDDGVAEASLASYNTAKRDVAVVVLADVAWARESVPVGARPVRCRPNRSKEWR